MHLALEAGKPKLLPMDALFKEKKAAPAHTSMSFLCSASYSRAPFASARLAFRAFTCSAAAASEQLCDCRRVRVHGMQGGLLMNSALWLLIITLIPSPLQARNNAEDKNGKARKQQPQQCSGTGQRSRKAPAHSRQSAA